MTRKRIDTANAINALLLGIVGAIVGETILFLHPGFLLSVLFLAGVIYCGYVIGRNSAIIAINRREEKAIRDYYHYRDNPNAWWM